MKIAALLSVLPYVAAFPAVMDGSMEEAFNSLSSRANYKIPGERKPKFLSKRQNTGVIPPLNGFNAEDQFVDVTKGSGHAFKAPRESDIRGQCPGLNAAANHGFLPRNGIANTQQTTEGLAAAYNMAPDLAIFLAAVSIGLSGDPVKGTWSIGSGYKGTLPGIKPTGILGTHNQYEIDSSIVKGYVPAIRIFIDLYRADKHAVTRT